MFGIGSTELLVILVVALIVLGPKSLASFSRSLGKVMGEFRRVSTDFQRTLNYEAAQEELRAREAKAKPAPQESAAATPPPDSPVAQAVEKARQEAEGKKANTPETPGRTTL